MIQKPAAEQVLSTAFPTVPLAPVIATFIVARPEYMDLEEVVEFRKAIPALLLLFPVLKI